MGQEDGPPARQRARRCGCAASGILPLPPCRLACRDAKHQPGGHRTGGPRRAGSMWPVPDGASGQVQAARLRGLPVFAKNRWPPRCRTLRRCPCWLRMRLGYYGRELPRSPTAPVWLRLAQARDHLGQGEAMAVSIRLRMKAGPGPAARRPRMAQRTRPGRWLRPRGAVTFPLPGTAPGRHAGLHPLDEPP